MEQEKEEGKQRNPAMRREPPQFPPKVIAQLRKARLQREQQQQQQHGPEEGKPEVKPEQ